MSWSHRRHIEINSICFTRASARIEPRSRRRYRLPGAIISVINNGVVVATTSLPLTMKKPLLGMKKNSTPHRGSLDGGGDGHIGRQVRAIDLEFATHLGSCCRSIKLAPLRRLGFGQTVVCNNCTWNLVGKTSRKPAAAVTAPGLQTAPSMAQPLWRPILRCTRHLLPNRYWRPGCSR